MPGHYDLVVIGSGPAGQKAAISAAKARKRVALIEKRDVVGGVCINTGTIPSKALREAVLHLTGYRERTFYGVAYSVKQHITMSDLMFRCGKIVRNEIEVIRAQMARNGVDLYQGKAVFKDPHTVQVLRHGAIDELTADCVLVAVGTEPARPASIPFDGKRIIDSDELLKLESLPRSMTIVGAGVIGAEYTCMMQAVGVKVTLIDARERMLEFLDREIADALVYQMRDAGVRMLPGESVRSTTCDGGFVRAVLDSGKTVAAETLLFCAGRQGATEKLNLEAAGLEPDSRGRLVVNEHYQTKAGHIYAAGDVIGFPSLAATSMEQGRLAMCHAFGLNCESLMPVFPYGIYAIPEISMVGRNERELTDEGVPYEVGIARYREISRGQLIGDTRGLLKLIFHQETRKILGVHIIGEGATELVHIGQAVMAHGGTLDYFLDNVFNYPTLAECYKVAALDGSNRIACISPRGCGARVDDLTEAAEHPCASNGIEYSI